MLLKLFELQVVEVAASKLSWDRKASKERWFSSSINGKKIVTWSLCPCHGHFLVPSSHVRWMKKLGARDAGQDTV